MEVRSQENSGGGGANTHFCYVIDPQNVVL